jgi:hypothetical protein
MFYYQVWIRFCLSFLSVSLVVDVCVVTQTTS